MVLQNNSIKKNILFVVAVVEFQKDSIGAKITSTRGVDVQQIEFSDQKCTKTCKKRGRQIVPQILMEIVGISFMTGRKVNAMRCEV